MLDSLDLFYFPAVEAELWTPVRTPQAPEAVCNFFRSYYVWAGDEADAVAIVSEDVVRDGADLRGYDPPVVRKEDEFPPELLAKAGKPRSRGVYWRSGRVFYPSE